MQDNSVICGAGLLESCVNRYHLLFLYNSTHNYVCFYWVNEREEVRKMKCKQHFL